MKYHWEFC